MLAAALSFALMASAQCGAAFPMVDPTGRFTGDILLEEGRSTLTGGHGFLWIQGAFASANDFAFYLPGAVTVSFDRTACQRAESWEGVSMWGDALTFHCAPLSEVAPALSAEFPTALAVHAIEASGVEEYALIFEANGDFRGVWFTEQARPRFEFGWRGPMLWKLEGDGAPFESIVTLLQGRCPEPVAPAL